MYTITSLKDDIHLILIHMKLTFGGGFQANVEPSRRIAIKVQQIGPQIIIGP